MTEIVLALKFVVTMSSLPSPSKSPTATANVSLAWVKTPAPLPSRTETKVVRGEDRRNPRPVAHQEAELRRVAAGDDEVYPPVPVKVAPCDLKWPESDPEAGRGVELRRGTLAGRDDRREGEARHEEK